MKKKIWIAAAVVALAVIALVVFWKPILNLLPIDQSGWTEVEGIRAYRGPKGEPVTGWLELEGKRYYLKENGTISIGWQQVEGERCFFDENGAAVTGWLKLNGLRYYFDADGSMATGWVETGEGRCYFDEDGALHLGWLEENGQTYYLTDSGVAAVGWLELESGRYYMDPAAGCAMATGWLETEEGIYCLNEDGTLVTGWLDTPEGRCYMDDTGLRCTGWLELEGRRFYLDEKGIAVQGWQEIDGQRRHFGEDGSMTTGWLETETALYYLKEDGIPAVGKQVIDDRTYYFTSTGANIILVNPWNYVPEDYTVDIVTCEYGGWVDSSCVEALEQMLGDCRAAGYHPKVASSYRTQADQQYLYNNMVENKKKAGYSDPYAEAAKVVAIPGTSEHQLGLAVDIVDVNYTELNTNQEKTATQKWLMEHSWEYGFLLRFPNEKTEITGIIYEPWHYRYVGLELAKEIHELGICLEEYLDMLTDDGTTCGGLGRA